MNLRSLWQVVKRWYDAHPPRDRRILLGLASAVGLSLVWLGVVDPVRGYRRGVVEETQEGLEELERSARFLAAIEGLRAERDHVHKRLEQVKSRLLPGGSGTLGAAALQERANTVASENGITVQSTQVMRDEPAEPFRKVSIRLTLSGNLKELARLISGLEYDKHLVIPFVELSRRGATGGGAPRTIQGTVEVSGYVQPAKAENADAAGEGQGPAPTPETPDGGSL
jgi:type II secretory pathway component PulM